LTLIFFPRFQFLTRYPQFFSRFFFYCSHVCSTEHSGGQQRGVHKRKRAHRRIQRKYLDTGQKGSTTKKCSIILKFPQTGKIMKEKIPVHIKTGISSPLLSGLYLIFRSFSLALHKITPESDKKTNTELPLPPLLPPPLPLMARAADKK
jgi:hypothetical protein